MRARGVSRPRGRPPGITRLRSGRGFSYRTPSGALVTYKRELARIKSLAVPPAYTGVWICPDPDGHIQATGRDQKGRKQYRYHPRWREVRDLDKFARVLEFARLLPFVRARVEQDMQSRGLTRERVLATVVNLLDRTNIRVGNSQYAKANASYGLTTLETRHVAVDGQELKFHFKGKSGKMWRLQMKDRRIARLVRNIQELPGQALFQYVDDDGEIHAVESSDVNDYLREITGADISSKDFRTWAGTVLAAQELAGAGPCTSQREAKSKVRDAIGKVAHQLGNTATVCRKCYVHPHVIESFMVGQLPAPGRSSASAQTSWENAVIAFLERQIVAQRPATANSKR